MHKPFIFKGVLLFGEGAQKMLTGTFIGTMIASSCVVLSFILLQPYVYWRFIFDRSQFVKMFYVLIVNAMAALLAMLFAYKVDNGVIMDTRLAPLLIILIGGKRYPVVLPVLTALMIAGMRFGISTGSAAVWALIDLLVVAVSLTILNIWLREKSFNVRLWTHSILGNVLNVLIIWGSGLFAENLFLEKYALIVFVSGVVTTLAMAMVYEMLYVEIHRRTRLLANASTDHLTGLPNRRAVDEYMSQQMGCIAQGEDDLTIAILDIDFFKRVNDTYGHEIGDQVLKKVGLIMHDNVRAADLAGRYGGEEFVLVFPHLSKKVAYEIVERIRHTIERTPFVIEQDRKIHVTVSCGMASLSETSERTLKVKADQRLYLAKTQGRNRTVNEGE